MHGTLNYWPQEKWILFFTLCIYIKHNTILNRNPHFLIALSKKKEQCTELMCQVWIANIIFKAILFHVLPAESHLFLTVGSKYRAYWNAARAVVRKYPGRTELPTLTWANTGQFIWIYFLKQRSRECYRYSRLTF
jgi:hypothetical protein